MLFVGDSTDRNVMVQFCDCKFDDRHPQQDQQQCETQLYGTYTCHLPSNNFTIHTIKQVIQFSPKFMDETFFRFFTREKKPNMKV